MTRARIATAFLLLLLLAGGASTGLAISPPSEIVTDPSATQLTTLVPNAQNMQQADILAVLNDEAAKIARELTAEPEPAPAGEPGGAVPLRRREQAQRLEVRAVAAGEAGLTAAGALALTQIRERLADLHQALGGDTVFTARGDSGPRLAVLKEGIQGPVIRVLDATRVLVELARAPGAVADATRPKLDEALAAIYPLVRSMETQIAEGTR
jgi:hypothetical protein